jgi:uncharacterized coiled-coil protein SlyX
MKPSIQKKRITAVFRVALLIASFVFSQSSQAVVPPTDGCYPNYTTAEGCKALNFLTTGLGNTGVGWYSLYGDSTGNFNTGIGGGALALNNADSNTAVGAGALLLNTTGSENTAVGTDTLVHNDSGSDNTAVGAFALFNNIDGTGNNAFGDAALSGNIHATDNTAVGEAALFNNDVTGAGMGNSNTAVGSQALLSNTDGDSNTAVGFQALASNLTGVQNTATGAGALLSNTSGGNTAFGYAALQDNTMGAANIAVGIQALQHGTVGSLNVAIGATSLFNTTGDANIALGTSAGSSLTTGSHNIDIGNSGIAGESQTIRIGNVQQSRTFIAAIRGTITDNNNAIPVLIDTDGQLGTQSSSRRFKKEIRAMDDASEAILALKPVTFHYKSDHTDRPEFGLIAEEVAQVNPDLVVCDNNGEIYTVRYDAVNAMLLNEFLKEHKTVQQQGATISRQRKDFEAAIAQQQKEIETLTTTVKEQAAQIQKVSAQLELTKRAPQTVATNK